MFDSAACYFVVLGVSLKSNLD